jgi:hypothetical protein
MGAQELESQQAILLDVLRSAAGESVSYEQLRQAGIEFPASVASELELAGVDIEHCRVQGEPREDGHHSGEPGLRLQPTPADEAATIVLSPARTARLAELVASERLADSLQRFGVMRNRFGRMRYALDGVRNRFGRLRGGDGAAVINARSRWLVAVGLLAVLAAVLVVVLSVDGSKPSHASRDAASHASKLRAGVGHADASSRTHARGRTSPPTESAGAPSASHTGAATGTEAPPGAHADASTQVSPALAAQLESEGHSLLESGSSSAAIPVLSKAVAATGESEVDCVEPASEACLTYAYALYDLGRALLESGDASAAVPVLQRRLQINNQRPVVEEALASARARAG